jgi:hypothetical protein
MPEAQKTADERRVVQLLKTVYYRSGFVHGGRSVSCCALADGLRSGA